MVERFFEKWYGYMIRSSAQYSFINAYKFSLRVGEVKLLGTGNGCILEQLTVKEAVHF